MHRKNLLLTAFLIILLPAVTSVLSQQTFFPGADEKTPSRAQYFSWINNTNEGATEKHTLANLEFFKWLHDEYGMVLDIYAFDAGAIDGKGFYGKTDSDRFKKQFPNGFGPVYQKARSMNTRLGVWGGPDGFGNTPEEERARTEMMVGLCRDYEFMLFKFDAVSGSLRPEKQDAFVNMMIECRKYSHDLILLNHRLQLGKGLPYATTSLWGGAETYIDVHMPNRSTGTHHRVGALSRGLPPDLQRLTEDHGVCLSSCLDYWEDDLILQAFNRCLILAPEIYGNPWLLRDDEFPKLARIYNLHRHYRDILVNGLPLPEENYGPHALSRGDETTRFVTLRNLTWNPVTYTIKLDTEIGLAEKGKIELRQFHPTENIMGKYDFGTEVKVEVQPFRSCLLMAAVNPVDEIGIDGCDYEVVRDTPGKPVLINLLGMPGSEKTVKLVSDSREFSRSVINGNSEDGLVQGKSVKVAFEGPALNHPWHRKLGDLEPCEVPVDAEALYEATCFAADNNALEVRSLLRSGPTKIPQVQNARDAFLGQALFVERGLWDKNLFDGDLNTSFYPARRFGDVRVNNGSVRIDFGEELRLDKFIINVGSEHSLQPLKTGEIVRADFSADLVTWEPIFLLADKIMECEINPDKPVRYVRIHSNPDRILEIEGYFRGTKLDRSLWRASNLFSPYRSARARKAWSCSVTLDEIVPESYLAIAVNGNHGREGVYAAVRVDGKHIGAPDRAVSFPSNTWEYIVRSSSRNYTYYIPVTPEMTGKKIDVVVLGLNREIEELKPEVWITAYPIPFVKKELVLYLK